MDFVTASTGLISPYWMGLPIRYIHTFINGTLNDTTLKMNYSYFLKVLNPFIFATLKKCTFLEHVV